MLYEKKMLILSGEGKGVVLIEKSAHGVKFSLRTFDMPTCDVLKAGVVTRSAVFVRDLPGTDNPAAVFTVDAGDIEQLHFAVFDKSIRLYGTNTDRMWDANLLDLFAKHERRAPVLDGTPTALLPPIAKKPRVLPMPDGTGIPQSRLAIYGDEAIAESDFYTSLDFDSRMPEVDGFLDSPRVLDGLAPRIVPLQRPMREVAEEVTAVVDGEQSDIKDRQAQSENATTDEATELDGCTDNDPPVNIASEQEERAADKSSVGTVPPYNAETAEHAEAAAAAPKIVGVDYAMPWELTARWLKNRTKRSPILRKEQVKKVEPNEQVRHIRESAFFERAREDIEALFANAERDKTLAELLPDMEWVKVEFDGQTISVGRSGNVLLCYAVGGAYEKNSPLGLEAQWLPSQRNMPTGKGYWLIFQNLTSGEIVKN